MNDELDKINRKVQPILSAQPENTGKINITVKELIKLSMPILGKIFKEIN